MAADAAWALNLDADLELAAGTGYRPTRAVAVAVERHAVVVARSLLGPGDVVVNEATVPGSCAGRRGRAFCPTPRALALLHGAGAEPDPAPEVEVLRRVASRAFNASLGATMPDQHFSDDPDRIASILARPASIGRAWRLKRAYGMAGRGHRVVEPGPLREADRAFVAASAGLQVEPDVEIVSEFGVHGLIEGDRLQLGTIVGQRCDARGAWIESFAMEAPPFATALVDEATRVAAALRSAGYFGPFGIDAFTYRVGAEVRLQPRSEINPRFSMGFAVGLPGA